VFNMRNMFSRGSKVRFEFDGKIHVGTIFIIDYRESEVAKCYGLKKAGYTYDIEVNSENMLYKHIPEVMVSSVEEESER